MKPPVYAGFLLRLLTPRHMVEVVTGDLEEEFLLVASKDGQAAARSWYVRQVAGSAGWLMAMRAREAPAALLGVLVAAPLPWLLMDRLWSFVYSQIPLKAGLERSSELVLTAAALVAMLAFVAGWVLRRDALWPALLCGASTVAAVALSTGEVPAGFHGLLFAMVTGCWVSGSELRRRLRVR